MRGTVRPRPASQLSSFTNPRAGSSFRLERRLSIFFPTYTYDRLYMWIRLEAAGHGMIYDMIRLVDMREQSENLTFNLVTQHDFRRAPCACSGRICACIGSNCDRSISQRCRFVMKSHSPMASPGTHLFAPTVGGE